MNRLSKLKNYEINKEDHDIRNWKVILHNMSIGRVKELIIDAERDSIKFIEIQKKEKFCNNKYMRGRYFLIPMAFLTIDSYKKHVIIKTKDTGFLELYPSYDLFFPVDYKESIKEYIRDYKIKYRWEKKERTSEKIRLHKIAPQKSTLFINLKYNNKRKQAVV